MYLTVDFVTGGDRSIAVNMMVFVVDYSISVEHSNVAEYCSSVDEHCWITAEEYSSVDVYYLRVAEGC